MTDQRPVLLCTDGSAVAQAAVETACGFLAPGPAEALSVWLPAPVLHTHTPASAVVEVLLLEPASSVDAMNARDCERAAEEAARTARAAGFTCEARAQRSEEAAWRAILDRADAIDAKAIVFGSHGRSGISERLLGGVAHRLTNHSRRPIVLIPAPAPARDPRPDAP